MEFKINEREPLEAEVEKLTAELQRKELRIADLQTQVSKANVKREEIEKAMEKTLVKDLESVEFKVQKLRMINKKLKQAISALMEIDEEEWYDLD